MVINKVRAIIVKGTGEMTGAGIKRAISMSNTRKITTRIKNRNENGIRAEEWGSKPHSNGDIFSNDGILW